MSDAIHRIAGNSLDLKPKDGKAMQSALRNMRPDDLASFVREAQRWMAEAFTAQGARAFDYPRSAAAAHESGHAVHFKAQGVPVTGVRIFSRRNPFRGDRAWTGITQGSPAWRSDVTTDPAQDLKNARIHLSGLLGEMLLEGEAFRFASSIDELVMARLLVAQAAFKLGADADRLNRETVTAVMAILTHNRAAHVRLARLLFAKCTIRGKPLERLLEGIGMPAVNIDGGGQ